MQLHEFTPAEMQVVATIAKSVAHKFHLEKDDLQQECYLWMVNHRDKVLAFRELDHGEATLATWLKWHLIRIAKREVERPEIPMAESDLEYAAHYDGRYVPKDHEGPGARVAISNERARQITRSDYQGGRGRDD